MSESKKKSKSSNGRKRNNSEKKRVARKRRPQRKNCNMAATGSGAYRLTGGVSWGHPDSWFRGNIGGEVTDGAISGSGAYNIGKPVRQNTVMKDVTLSGDIPMVANVGKGEATVIRHREFVRNIKSGDFVSGTTSTDYKIESFTLNPGNRDLFPWLSSTAKSYQEYRFTGMLIEAKTLSSNLSTTLTLGSIFMATDYNVYAVPPPDKTHVENMEFSTSAKPSQSSLMPIECARRYDANTHLYISENSLNIEGADRRLYDMATVHICSEGIPSENADIAELWVTYEVLLYKPRLPDLSGTPCYFMEGDDPNAIAQPLGTSFNPVDLQGLNTSLVVVDQGTNDVDSLVTISFVGNTTPQAWFLTFHWHGSNAPATYFKPPTLTIVNGSFPDDWIQPTQAPTGFPTTGGMDTKCGTLSTYIMTGGGSTPTVIHVGKDGDIPGVNARVQFIAVAVDNAWYRRLAGMDLAKQAVKASRVYDLERKVLQLERLLNASILDNEPDHSSDPPLQGETTTKLQQKGTHLHQQYGGYSATASGSRRPADRLQQMSPPLGPEGSSQGGYRVFQGSDPGHK